MTNEEVAREIANAVVERLFVNVMGERAERLVLWTDSRPKNLGGWCADSVQREVEKIARAALQPAAKEKITAIDKE